MSERFDAIVIGAGAAGSAAGYQLSKDGRRVLLLEQFEIGHARGSSHGESRIFRFAYPQAWYAKFAMQSEPLWRELERDCEEKLLHTTGGLDFADDPDCFGEVRQIRDALRANGAACEELTGKEIRTRFPQWRNLPDDAVGTFSPDAGWLSATRCVRAMCGEVVKRGGVVRDAEPVTGLTSDIEVTTRKGRYRADKLVIAAGAWANSLLRFVGVELPLRVTKEQPVYFAPLNNAEQFRSPRFPIWIHYCKPAFTYGFPMNDIPGVKLAFHHDGPLFDPNSADRAPRKEVTERLREYLRRYLPDAAGEMVEETVCLYTTTPDHDFVIDLARGLPNVAIASPCSGHGFKFAVGTGRALADLVQHGRTTMEISRNRRFSNGP